MSFASAVTSAPIPYDPAKGAEAAARVAGTGAAFEALVAGAAGCAPHLAHLAEAEADWLLEAARGTPEAALKDALAGARGGELHDLASRLRRAKRRIGLLTALADLGGVWGLDEVTGALSRLADEALQTCAELLVAEARQAGRLPPTDAPCGGLVILSMGKLGAVELNYSSDIDLIALFDEGNYPPDDYATVRKQFIRIVQRMMKLMSEETGEGYVFRTDLRLRPDPSVTPVCIGMGAAEYYYESQGRTWERAAFIRARVSAGDRAAGQRFLDDLTPFIWRRHLDFAAIEDAHDMRRRIREHKGLTGAFRLPGHNVKLGRGGIREIEFFVQTNQLICGGRDPSLRESRTRPAMAALARAGWVPQALAEELAQAYVDHRTLEHRIQMIEDAQTHLYPADRHGRDRMAAFCGADDRDAFEAGLAERFERVHRLAEDFFAPDEPDREGGEGWDAFPDPERTREVVESWARLPALRSERAQRIFGRLKPQAAARLSGAARPDLALESFDRFLRGLPAGVQVFSLFDANPQILDLLLDVCATAPRLADHLGRRAGALDAVLSGRFFDPLAPVPALEAELAEALAAADGYEAVLDAARVWAREQRFRVGVQLLRRIASPDEAGAAFSAVAEAVLRALLPHVIAEHARKHGAPPGGGVAVLALGKLGSSEMTAASDLDLIIVYDAAPDMTSEGRRPLAASAYYARLTQALVSALSAPTAEGELYEVDMRLRPSGRQGPVATSLSGFVAYHAERAWTWEHLALTRGRVVAGPDPLCAALRRAMADTLDAPRDRAKVLADVREMRARIAESRQTDDPWAMKERPGRLRDIELALQTGKLLTPGITACAPRRMIDPLAKAGFLTGDEADHLRTAVARLMGLQHYARLALFGDFDVESGGPGLNALVAEAGGAGNIEALRVQLAEDAERSERIVTRVLEG
ncbi:bifunctional [glutamine synthetase] adenylyltransferase/[glutamine synthetase]-adenylyl-L-tyrosine phosphorylase [Rhodobacteraceae bacterium 2CG4]|uniref:Bifunctional [glutamine synthetase] adenylyltransferase/[glutamine synthetase]-adenylyl-L-tyrosine phosphorylase n=1 Tax=Halovulum marinum TaxID=2662447 RepID=A0A6L5Z1X5_9RHOB|nr:bifunctional [glutamine synthetase] adenylyltransferase/[glutamine synthetase]-adenylyl-L-tyrosine phosphorylase [Halovulum marinum]MSU90004.1 bifunctional [glutamine synthetase] adenylyltransferase/[glutamine synthetase]-adenylyl-L-tyrosine phosphorylase [Halovulum marinum]